MIKVAIIDEDEHRQLELRSFINAQPELACANVVAGVTEFLQQLSPDSINLIIISITNNNDSTGKIRPSQIRKIKEFLPGAEIIILADSTDTKKVLTWLRAGVVGYLPRNTSFGQLKEAIIGSHNGGAYIMPLMVRKMLNFFHVQADMNEVLTHREKEIVQCLVEGMSYKLIADKLDVALDTVRYHLRNIYKKLKVNSKTQVVSKAISGEISF